MYDVFVSHNRRHKTWVRSLVLTLRAVGVQVFFDEDNIPAGSGLVEAISRGVTESRHVLLIASPEALASRWVGLEALLAVQEDLTGEDRRLIIALLDGVTEESLPAWMKARRWIDLRSSADARRGLRDLFGSLGVPANLLQCADLSRLADSIPGSAQGAMLHVAAWADVLDWGWTEERLLEELIRLDYETIDGLSEGDEGSVQQWAPIFCHYPESWRLLCSHPERIVGYWHAVPLHDPEYAAACSGDLVDGQLSPAYIPEFSIPGIYNLYFVQICLLKRYRGSKALGSLVASLFGTLTSLASEGVFFREVSANAYTPAGESLCRTFGMVAGRHHRNRGRIYSASMGEIFKRASRIVPEGLRASYACHGIGQ